MTIQDTSQDGSTVLIAELRRQSKGIRIVCLLIAGLPSQRYGSEKPSNRLSDLNFACLAVVLPGVRVAQGGAGRGTLSPLTASFRGLNYYRTN